MQDGVDLDQRAARQPGDADRGARRERLAYVLRHDFVDARKVRKIRQVDRHAHGLVEARAGCGGDGREVAEHPVGLAVDALGQLQGRRVETDLARQVHGVVRSNRLRVSADRLGRVARLDRGLHGGYLSLMISDLEKLLGTPRDGALLRFSLGVQYAKAGEHERAIGYLRDSVASDPLYSAAWKALGKTLADAAPVGLQRFIAAAGVGECLAERLPCRRVQRIEAAKRKGDKQAEKEMTVFARRLERQRGS